jgi:hypothetical protein
VEALLLRSEVKRNNGLRERQEKITESLKYIEVA